MLAATGLKEKVTGKEFITAFVVGHEVMIRIGNAVRGVSEGRFLGRGHGHSIFGCVASVAKLLGLTLDEIENAEGIARGMTQPHDLAMYVPPTLMIRAHHAFIAQDAINVCLLAKRGITGPRQQVLTGFFGYLGLSYWKTNPGSLTRGLGEVWEIVNIVTKSYTCWIGAHNSISWILDSMEKFNFNGEDIASIHVTLHSINITGVMKDKWYPQTYHDCQFSLPYLVATAAYSKNVFLDSFTPEAMAHKGVRDLMTRISVSGDQSLGQHEHRIHVTLKDGRDYSGEAVHLKGSRENPLSEEEFINKFKKSVHYSAYKLSDEVVDTMIKEVLSLEKVDDVVNTLLAPLTPT